MLDSINTEELLSHERAEIWNLYGYAYYLLDAPNLAVGYYERVLGEPDAKVSLRERTLKTVAQLHMLRDGFAPALNFYQQWLDLQETPVAEDYALMAMIHYNLDQKQDALRYIEKAIGINESQGLSAKLNWYSIQRSIYYEQQDCSRALAIVRKIQDAYPSAERFAVEARKLEGMIEGGCNTGKASDANLAALGRDWQGRPKGEILQF